MLGLASFILAVFVSFKWLNADERDASNKSITLKNLVKKI